MPVNLPKHGHMYLRTRFCWGGRQRKAWSASVKQVKSFLKSLTDYVSRSFSIKQPLEQLVLS